jgi:nucleotide-binding universal stress UspA family protein
MFQKILVALDTSSRSDHIFQDAVEVAKNNNAALLLLHVLTSEEEGSPLRIPPGIEEIYWAPSADVDLERWHQEWQQYEQKCLKHLRRYTDQATGEGVDADFQQVSGIPGNKICEIAASWGADLIMLGNRGRRGVTELVLGSVSNYVLHHAECSVLVVKPAVRHSATDARATRNVTTSEVATS